MPIPVDMIIHANLVKVYNLKRVDLLVDVCEK